MRIQEVGPLAEVIFDRIASSQEFQTRGIYSTEAMDEYSIGSRPKKSFQVVLASPGLGADYKFDRRCLK